MNFTNLITLFFQKCVLKSIVAASSSERATSLAQGNALCRGNAPHVSLSPNGA
jgi:hypothetical protein